MAKDEKPIAWVSHLPDHFEQHGLKVEFTKAYEAPRRYLRVWSDLFLHLMEEFAAGMQKPEVFALIAKAALEVEKGCIVPSPFPLMVVGKKPLED